MQPLRALLLPRSTSTLARRRLEEGFRFGGPTAVQIPPPKAYGAAVSPAVASHFGRTRTCHAVTHVGYRQYL